MINRALQGFLTTTYGDDVWAEIRNLAALPFDDFESMLTYEDSRTLDCFTAACQVMHRSPTAMLEDLGTFLITHPPLDPLRRLLRFGGTSFQEFILSLDELAERGRMAMPAVEMPEIEVREVGVAVYELRTRWKLPGIGAILFGALRAMADDYGALATLKLAGVQDGVESLRIEIFDSHHAEDRGFRLGEAVA